MTAPQIVIDDEFKTLIPSLSVEERAQLEVNLLRDGKCLDPLVIWKETNILLDGHTRYGIATKHRLEYETRYRSFSDRSQALEWMRRHQLGRRNLNDYQKVLLAAPLAADEIRESKKQPCPNSDKPVNSGAVIARVAEVSRDTVYRVQYLEKNASECTKQDLRDGKVSINSAYTALRRKLKPPTKPKASTKASNSAAAATTKQPLSVSPNEEAPKTLNGLKIVSIDPAKIERDFTVIEIPNPTDKQLEKILEFVFELIPSLRTRYSAVDADQA